MTQFCIEEAVFERLERMDALAQRGSLQVEEYGSPAGGDPLDSPELAHARQFAQGRI